MLFVRHSSKLHASFSVAITLCLFLIRSTCLKFIINYQSNAQLLVFCTTVSQKFGSHQTPPLTATVVLICAFRTKLSLISDIYISTVIIVLPFEYILYIFHFTVSWNRFYFKHLIKINFIVIKIVTFFFWAKCVIFCVIRYKSLFYAIFLRAIHK